MKLRAVPHKNERVELEMKILRYRQLVERATWDEDAAKRLKEVIAELERPLGEIDK
jgi:hypothetical protein